MSDEQIAVVERPQMVVADKPADTSPGALLRLAIERDLPLEKLQQLLDLQERWEATAAKKAYVAAMGDLKRQDCPVIVRDKKVSFMSSKGLVEYEHASLAQVAASCVEALAKHGFHHDWECRQEKGSVEVTCVVTHRQGHSTKKTMSAPPDPSGAKNQIQAIASTVTYLQRYTLLMALGLAPGGDDDGRASGAPVQQNGHHEPPVDPDGEPSPRARKAIAVWGKYLGAQSARSDMERLLGKPAGSWGDGDYGVLMEVWQVVKAADGDEAKTRALVAEIERRTAGGR